LEGLPNHAEKRILFLESLDLISKAMSAPKHWKSDSTKRNDADDFGEDVIINDWTC
jgi:hypothetical protein